MTAFGIVEALEEFDGAGVVELAEHLDLSQSTVHDHLSTLVALEYVRREAGEYRLGLKFLQHGIHARDSLPFFDTADLEVDLLAHDTGEVAWLYTEEYGRAVVVYKATGDDAMETIGRVGWRPPLHSTAAGKAMLSEMPDERVEEILDRHGLAEMTPNTITTREALLEELSTVRERGYAVNDEENNEGILAVGAPVTHEGSVVAAVSVSGPSHRFSSGDTLETVVGSLLDTTNQIELRLRYDRTD